MSQKITINSDIAIDVLNAKQSMQIKEWSSLVGWDPIWAAVFEGRALCSHSHSVSGVLQ